MFVIDGEEVMMMYTSSKDPDNFEDAVKSEKWRKAMEAEIGSIEENNTWELVELPLKLKSSVLSGFSRQNSMKREKWKSLRQDW